MSPHAAGGGAPPTENDIEELQKMIRKVTGVELATLPFTHDEIRDAVFALEMQLMQGLM